MIGLIAVTAAGEAAAARLAAAWPGETRIYQPPASQAVPQAWADCSALVCFLATGATVRLIAPLLADKHTDPAVVCVDEACRFAVALAGGHGTSSTGTGSGTDGPGTGSTGTGSQDHSSSGPAGGANALATRVAAVLGAEAVITTATDAADIPGLDALGWPAEGAVAAVSRAMLDGEPVRLVTTSAWPLPAFPPNVGPGGAHRILVTDQALPSDGQTAIIRPPSLAVGVGASRGVTADEVLELVDSALARAGLSPLSVAVLATVDAKATEPGIIEAAARRGWPLATYPAQALARVRVPNPSPAPLEAVGTPSVAEAAALTSAAGLAQLPAPRTPADQAGTSTSTSTSTGTEATTGATITAHTLGMTDAPPVLSEDETAPMDFSGLLLIPKQKSAMATAAVARIPPRGRLALVGIGPGARDLLAPRAITELRRASVVVGLDSYLDQIRDLLRPGTRVLGSGLGAEEERARVAVDEARQGNAVALVGSGDAGIYSMASPALSLAGDDIDVVGVPGITASLAAAALLGAPLGHDHVAISLSDLNTPWDVIKRRVRAAADGDFVVAFYNPRSRGRDWQLRAALDILAASRPAGTPAGIVRNATRPGQQITVTTLKELDVTWVDMLSIVVVGCSATELIAGRMVTPRGYSWQ